MAETRIHALWVCIALAVGSAAPVQCAELKVLSPVAMRGALTDITRKFEAASEHKIAVDFATAGAVAARVQAGEIAEVAISSVAQIETLEAKGRLVAGTRCNVARVGLGLFVKQGAARPAIETVAQFKQAMASARSIGYGDPAAGGVSGIHMARLIERLALGELQSKIKLFPDSQAVMAAIVKGEVELGFGLTSDAVLVPGTELASTLPADIQNFTEYAAAVVAGATQGPAASAFVKHLCSPETSAAWKTKGFEPL